MPGRISAFWKACPNSKSFRQGLLLQADIEKVSSRSSTRSGNSLVSMCIRVSHFAEAHVMSDCSHSRNLQSYNELIDGHAQKGLFCEAFQILRKMDEEGMKPDRSTFISVLKACSKVKAEDHIKQLHALIVKNRLELDIYVGTSLLDGYAKCGNLTEARYVFDNLLFRNLVSWNTMISLYAQNGCGLQALELFEKMQREGRKPDRITFTGALKACGLLGALEKGELIHSLIRKSNIDSDVIIGNSLIDMYMKCRSIQKAWLVFDKLPKKDVISWNSIIGGHVRHGLSEQALLLFKSMEKGGVEPDGITYVFILKACGNIGSAEEGILVHSKILRRHLESDVFVGTALVNMYAKCKKLLEARQVFEGLKVRTKVSWNTMIAGYVNNKSDKEAIKLFEQMQQSGTKPDKITFQSVLKACGRTSLHQGRLIHRQAIELGLESEMHIGSTLVDMYANFGSLDEAYKAFNKLSVRDTVSWNAMITGYAQQGSGKEVLQMFKTMQDEGMEPDAFTFVSVLKACGTMIDIENGKLVHSMVLKKKLGSDLFVGNAIIDMYAKCGSLKDAKQVFDSMMEKDLVTWNTMIASYVRHGYGYQALGLLKNMEEQGLKPDSFTFISALKACGCIGAVDEGELIHARIRDGGLEPDLVVETNLVDMYAKCGRLDKAYRVFKSLKTRDAASWNAILGGCAHLGLGVQALKVFEDMVKDGVQPSDATFVCALSACSHDSLVEDGFRIFYSMVGFGIVPKWQHYSCMVDILSRAGKLLEAEDFIQKMPIQADADMWMSLLAACRTYGNLELAKRCFRSLLDINKNHVAAHILMSNIYASSGLWEEQVAVRMELEAHLASN